jgi:hypothetical protein
LVDVAVVRLIMEQVEIQVPLVVNLIDVLYSNPNVEALFKLV